MNADQRAAGFVLAGGRSSRMGRDKALVAFAGRPLIENALGIFRDAGLEPQIAGARSPLAEFAPVIEDRESGHGPLSGICAAFESTPAVHAVFLPVDLPLIPSSLLVYLLHHARITGHAVTLPALGGSAQTFPAVIDRAALPALHDELAAGRRACWKAFRAAGVSTVAVELLVQAGQVTDPRQLSPSQWFLNANTPGELERVLQLAGIGQAAARIP